MRNLRAVLAAAGIALLAACATKAAPAPPVVPPPPAPPQLENPQGEAIHGGAAMLLIRYKGLRIVVDPLIVSSGTAVAVDAAGTLTRRRLDRPFFKSAPVADYALFTDLAAHHGAPEAMRRRPAWRVIGSSATATAFMSAGFGAAKALPPGKRLLLQKGDAFVFVSAFLSQNPSSGAEVTSFFLEFDNGRNLVIAGDAPSADMLRPLVLAVRDQGKEIHMAFLHGGALCAPEADRIGADETALAAMMDLLLPRIAVVTQAGAFEGAGVDPETLKKALEGIFFDGRWHVARPGEAFGF